MTLLTLNSSKMRNLTDVIKLQSVSMQYYGIGLGITSVSESWSPYLMFLISSIAEAIGYASCHLNDRFSRKKVLILFFASTSVICCIVGVNKALLLLVYIYLKLILERDVNLLMLTC